MMRIPSTCSSRTQLDVSVCNAITCEPWSGFGGIVLQNLKMTCQQNFAARPSDRVFGDPMPRKELSDQIH